MSVTGGVAGLAVPVVRKPELLQMLVRLGLRKPELLQMLVRLGLRKPELLQMLV